MNSLHFTYSTYFKYLAPNLLAALAAKNTHKLNRNPKILIFVYITVKKNLNSPINHLKDIYSEHTIQNYANFIS